MSRAGVPSAALDAGIDLSNSYGGLALGCLLCTVFWSFLLVQTCVGCFPLLSFMAVTQLIHRVYYQAQSVPSHLPSQLHVP
jgi:hypothetical protein